VPLKFPENIFVGSYYGKFGHFSSKNHVKFGNVVVFFRANIEKFRAVC